MIDNLYNSSTEAVQRIEAIVGKSVPFENVDLTNPDAVRGVFAKYPIDSVIHFAALKVTPTVLSEWRLIAGRRGEYSNPIGILSCQCRWDDKFASSHA
jgi:nucleoside-diphosphate-sugar epimerase